MFTNRTLNRMSLSALTLLLLTIGAPGAAVETVVYKLGDSIDFPCIVSSPDNSQPRTLILPATLDKVIEGGWKTSDLKYEGVNNTVTFQLRNPSFAATIQLYDTTGQLYLVALRAAAANETPEPALTVVPPDSAGAVAGKLVWPEDTDSSTAILGQAMLSGKVPDGITVAPFSSTVDGKIVTGKILFEDDLLKITVMRMWIAPNLKGYETLWTWKGDRAVQIPIQRLYFPGLVAVHSNDQRVMRGNDPSVVFGQHSSTKIDLICVP